MNFDQNEVPNILLANEPSLSTNWAGGSCGSWDAAGNALANDMTLLGNRAWKALVHSAIEPGVDGRDRHVFFDQPRVLGLVGALFLQPPPGRSSD